MSGALPAFAPRGRNPFIERLAFDIIQHLQRYLELEDREYYIPESAADTTRQAVRFEIERFQFLSSHQISVDESVSDVLTEQISVFAFKPDPSWDVDPFLHSDYTVCLILAIPVSLRNIHKKLGLTGYIGARDALGWITEIKDAMCPYICPASP